MRDDGELQVIAPPRHWKLAELLEEGLMGGHKVTKWSALPANKHACLDVEDAGQWDNV